ATVAQARVVSAQSTSHRSFMRGSCLSEAEDVLPQAEGVAAVERCGHAGRKADEGAVAARKVLEQGVVAVPVEGAVAAGDEAILGEEELAQASADADRRSEEVDAAASPAREHPRDPEENAFGRPGGAEEVGAPQAGVGVEDRVEAEE